MSVNGIGSNYCYMGAVANHVQEKVSSRKEWKLSDCRTANYYPRSASPFRHIYSFSPLINSFVV